MPALCQVCKGDVDMKDLHDDKQGS